MEIFSIFIIGGIVIFFGFVGDAIFKRTGIPDALWLILVGMLLGPISGVISIEFFSPVTTLFTTFALVFILFEGAVNINIRYLLKGMPKGSLLTILSFIVSVAVITLISLAFLPLSQSILLGVILGGTSSAIVIPMVRRLKMRRDTSLAVIIESAISDVLCIICALTLINIINLRQFSLPQTLNTLLSSFTIALTLGFAAGFIWLSCLKKMGEYAKSYMATIAFLLILYGIADYVIGISGGGVIAAFAFGLVLGNSKKIFSDVSKEIVGITASKRFFYSEISFFLRSFFFVYLGLLISFPGYPLLFASLGLVLVLFAVRPLAVSAISRGIKRKEKAFFEVLIPRGLAAVVLAQLALHYGIPYAAQFVSIVPLVIFFSILLCTIFVFLVEKNRFHGFSSLYSALYHRLRKRKAKKRVVKKAEKKLRKEFEEKWKREYAIKKKARKKAKKPKTKKSKTKTF